MILVECKNWSRRISGMQLSWYVQKLKNRSQKYAVLVARNGIAGDDDNSIRAHEVIAQALREEIHIIIITKKDIENITDTDQIVKLIKEKLCNLVISVKVS